MKRALLVVLVVMRKLASTCALVLVPASIGCDRGSPVAPAAASTPASPATFAPASAAAPAVSTAPTASAAAVEPPLRFAAVLAELERRCAPKQPAASNVEMKGQMASQGDCLRGAVNRELDR